MHSFEHIYHIIDPVLDAVFLVWACWILSRIEKKLNEKKRKKK